MNRIKSLDDVLSYADARRKTALTFVKGKKVTVQDKDGTIQILNECVEYLLNYLKQQTKLKHQDVKQETDISELHQRSLCDTTPEPAPGLGEGSGDSDVPF